MRSAVAMVTAITDATFTEEVLRHEGWKEIPAVFMTQALKFWRSMDPALEAKRTHGRSSEATTKASIDDRPPVRSHPGRSHDPALNVT
jgi:hypothetical protein